MCSKLRTKTPFSSASIVSFEKENISWLMIVIPKKNRQSPWIIEL